MLVSLKQILNKLSDPSLQFYQTGHSLLQLLSRWLEMSHKDEAKLDIWEIYYFTSA